MTSQLRRKNRVNKTKIFFSRLEKNRLGFTDRTCFLSISSLILTRWRRQTKFTIGSSKTCPTKTYSRSNAFAASSTFRFAHSWAESKKYIYIIQCLLLSIDEGNHLFDTSILDNHPDKYIYQETSKSLRSNKAVHILLRRKRENMVKNYTHSL